MTGPHRVGRPAMARPPPPAWRARRRARRSRLGGAGSAPAVVAAPGPSWVPPASWLAGPASPRTGCSGRKWSCRCGERRVRSTVQLAPSLKNSDLAKSWGCCAEGACGPSPSPSSATPSSAQNRLVSGKDICSADAEIGSEPARTASSSSSAVASDSVPRSAPYTSTEAGWSTSPAAVTFKLAASSSGPTEAHPCQASMMAAARGNGHARWKFVASGAGTVRNTSDVTTPKLPAPAPRSAQNRSSSWFSSHSRTRPSARTIWAPIR